MYPHLSKIESIILVHITKSIKRIWDKESSAEWTKEIKKTLVKVGHQFRCKVRAAPEKEVNADSGEWLYDLCWLKEGRNQGLKLIAEIEWLNDERDILKDFQKLTVSIADYRLMVVYYNEKGKRYNRDWLSGIIKKCKELCLPNRNFRYFVIGVPHWNEKNIIKESWIK